MKDGVFKVRPKIGEMVMVHDSSKAPEPFKARVRSYHQCAPDCMIVTKAHTRIEHCVSMRLCTPTDQKESKNGK